MLLPAVTLVLAALVLCVACRQPSPLPDAAPPDPVVATSPPDTPPGVDATPCPQQPRPREQRPHRRPGQRTPPPADIRDRWRQKLCETTIRTMRAQGSVVTPGGLRVQYTIRDAPTQHFPGWVDSNSPAFWDSSELVVFNSAYYPMRSSGPSFAQLADPVRVGCTGCLRGGGRWLESVWRDGSTGLLYGWYHLEPDDGACLTAPIIGAAVSQDGGRTWQDRGSVLESGYPADCSYQNGYFVGGNGDFSVVADVEGGFFYFLFSTYGGPAQEQGVAVARSPMAARGQPGTVVKYFHGAWQEPGLSGRVTPLFASATGWKGPYVDAFWGPSVHWNESLRAYVMLVNHTAGAEWDQEGIYLSVSDDLLRWSDPQKVLDADDWYPQVMGLGAAGTDSRAGQVARLFIGGISKHSVEFTRTAG